MRPGCICSEAIRRGALGSAATNFRLRGTTSGSDNGVSGRSSSTSESELPRECPPGSDEVSETTSVYGDRINALIELPAVQETDGRLQHYAVLIEEHNCSYRRMWSKAIELAKESGTVVPDFAIWCTEMIAKRDYENGKSYFGETDSLSSTGWNCRLGV